MRIFIIDCWYNWYNQSLFCSLFSHSLISFPIIYLFLILLWQSFSIWDSILPSPCNVISGVDFNSIIVFLAYSKYFFILSIPLFFSSYGFPVNFIFSYDLQPPFNGGLFLALHVDTNFLILFQDAGVFFSGVCTCPLRLQSDIPFHWFNGFLFFLISTYIGFPLFTIFLF